MTMARVTRHGSQDGNSRITQTHTVISSNLSLKGLTSPTNRRQSVASATQAPGEVAARARQDQRKVVAGGGDSLGKPHPGTAERPGRSPRRITAATTVVSCRIWHPASLPCLARSSLFSPFRWLSGVGQREGAFGNLLFFH
jgi:hypothetical protein